MARICLRGRAWRRNDFPSPLEGEGDSAKASGVRGVIVIGEADLTALAKPFVAGTSRRHGSEVKFVPLKE